MKSVRLKQIGLALCLVLSLFASLVAACTCSHHEETTEIEASSCHSHSSETNTETDSTAKAQTNFAESLCICVQFTSKIVAKSERVKIEKTQISISRFAPEDLVSAAQTASETVFVSKPFYLSDSFYNLSKGRAPPCA